MTTLVILFILIGLGLYAVKEYYQIKLDVMPQKTSPLAVNAVISFLGVPDSETDPGGRILHLGSCYGTFVFQVARNLPAWQVDGLEQNPTLWLLSNLRSIGKNLINYRFFLGDFQAWPLKNYNVVFIDQTAKVVARWERSIARRLPADVLLISAHPLPHVRPVNTVLYDGGKLLYMYQKSAPAVAQPTVADQIEQPYNVEQTPPDFVPPDLPEPQPELPLETATTPGP